MLILDKDIFPALSTAKSKKERYYLKLRRECRGLMFNRETGKIISRRFHKFFNGSLLIFLSQKKTEK